MMRITFKSRAPGLYKLFAIIAALFVGVTLIDDGRARASSPQRSEISQTALDQIKALIKAKLERTPTERKIGSRLLRAMRMSRGQAIAESISAMRTDLIPDRGGRIEVDLDAAVTDDLLNAIKEGGGEVVNSFPQNNAIRARISIAQIELLAGQEAVRFIKPAVQAETNKSGLARVDLPALGSSTTASFLTSVRNALSVLPAQETSVGAATSSGDVAHRAAQARSTFGVNGSGVKVGVISDSFNRTGGASADVLSGDLPGPGNPNGFTTPVTIINGDFASGADEGRAMLQIVHDLAPGARLYFATGFNGEASFANNIQALRAAGCDIIIDDLGYFDESPFQDAIIAQAVNTVTASGALYFSSAGNAGNLNDSTSGVWEGDFADSGIDMMIDGTSVGRLHDFIPGQQFNSVTGGSQRHVDLFWSDALGQSANDYDVYVLNSAGTAVVDASDDAQTGTQDPYEFVNVLNVGERIAVVKFSGAARFIHLDTGRGRLSNPTSGQTRGHSCATDAFCVAAVNAATGGGSFFTGGLANPIEAFSSDGLRRVFYNANGTPITPGNLLASGGAVRQKPDVTAADGVATTLPGGSGLNPFFGTSAAAPHAGAVAALLKSFNPSLTAVQIRAILATTALDIEGAGVDRDSGAGIVMAFQALQAGAPPPAYQGFLDAAGCGIITGWAWDANQPNTVINVDIYDGTTLITTIPANLFREDIRNAGIGNGFHGFSFTVPSGLKNGVTHTIRAKFPGTSTELGSSPRTITCTGVAPNYQGFHDGAGCNTISGWAWDANDQNNPINVDIYDGAVLIAAVPAIQFRPDLVTAGIGNGFHGFSFTVPDSLKNGATHSIRVRFPGTATDLQRTPRNIICTGAAPVYQGVFEAGDCNTISGWAWDQNDPNSPINVAIFDGNQLIATVLAIQFRQSLVTQGIGNGFHVFVLNTPASLRNGLPHSIQVKFSGSSTQLQSSPRSITCP